MSTLYDLRIQILNLEAEKRALDEQLVMFPDNEAAHEQRQIEVTKKLRHAQAQLRRLEGQGHHG